MRIALVVLLLGNWCPQEDPRLRDLIEHLSDDEIRVREKAVADLVDLGKAAVPALQRLSVSSGDVELRARAASVLKRIAEGEIVSRHWKRGARITLVSEGAPVASVLEDLERQAGDSFLYDPADLQDPVVVSIKDLPFWDAVEALCRAAPRLTWEGDGNSLRFSRRERPPYPARRQEEFAVWLDGITFNRDFDFTGVARSTFTILLATAWDAGIAPAGIDQKLTEVLDEDGTNLMANDRFGGYGARMDIPKGRVRKEAVYAPLPQGSTGVRKFAKVKGYATFYFPRSYQDVSFDLQASTVPAQLERLNIAVRNFRIVKDACALEVIVSAVTTSGEPMLDRLPVADIVVLDELGGEHRAPTSSRSHSFSGTSYTIHENLQVPLPENRTPKTLRLRVLKDVLEKRVPFEFTDIVLE